MNPTERIKALQPAWAFGIGDLKRIWDDCHFKYVVGDHQLTDDDICFITEHLIRTISLLSFIRSPSDKTRDNVFKWVKGRKEIDKKLSTVTDDDEDLAWLSDEDIMNPFMALRAHFTAPILKAGTDITLERNQRMPYHEDDGKTDVAAYDIANGHLIQSGVVLNPAETRVRVWRKRLRIPEAQTEIDILKKLRSALDKETTEIQISTCICMVKSSDNEHIQSLSLDAQLGDLDRILLDTVPGDCSLMRDCLVQITGVAGAIEFLHRMSESNDPTMNGMTYCHLDLKPQNIIGFRGGESPYPVGIWKVIDFGISKVRRARTFLWAPEQRVTHTVSTTTKQLGGTYQPPEVNDQNEQHMGRRSDIWSLGCIFTEVLAANLGKMQELRADLIACHTENDGLPQNNPYFFYKKSQRSNCLPLGSTFELNRVFVRKLNEIPNDAIETHRAVLLQCKDLIEKMVVIKRIKRMKSGPVLEKLNGIVGTSTNF